MRIQPFDLTLLRRGSCLYHAQDKLKSSMFQDNVRRNLELDTGRAIDTKNKYELKLHTKRGIGIAFNLGELPLQVRV